MAKTIMVVDDEIEILNSIDVLLKQEGYNVVKANDGDEALEKLKSVKPDLILLDFFMPKMSGGEILRRIRADDNLKDIKVAFLTVASYSSTIMRRLEKMNILDYIKKPFDNKDLVQRIKKMIVS